VNLFNEQVEAQEKKKTPKGRAKKRITYTRRFVNVTMTGGKRKVRLILYIWKRREPDEMRDEKEMNIHGGYRDAGG
jgi:hypothetical protein